MSESGQITRASQSIGSKYPPSAFDSVGFGDTSFQTRQKIGIWGEITVFKHFTEHPEHGVKPLKYGEASTLKKKANTDAVCRPDILLIELDKVPSLKKAGIDLDQVDLRVLPDSDPIVKKVVDLALVAMEVKFSHREYRKGRVNFIIDEVREGRYGEWLKRTRNVGALMTWFTTNKAFMAPTDRLLKEGTPQERTYEMIGKAGRTKKTINFPVESAEPFADVLGYELNKTFKPRLVLNKDSGSISFDLDDPLVGDLANVNMPRVRELAEQLRRR